MAKAPAFQFYVKDWLSDPQLKMASHSTKGIWVDMLCFMWDAPERGELTGTKAQFQRLLSATDEDINRFFDEAKTLSFCYFSVTGELLITVRNRRMYRESKDRENNRLRQERFRGKRKSNIEITPPSSSPSPSPKKEIVKKAKIELKENHFLNIPDALTVKWREVAPGINIQDEIKKAELWLLAHPEKRRSRYDAFLSNWMVRAQDNFIKHGGNVNGNKTPPGYRTNIRGQVVPDESEALNARYYAGKAAEASARNRTAGVPDADDVPDFPVPVAG